MRRLFIGVMVLTSGWRTEAATPSGKQVLDQVARNYTTEEQEQRERTSQPLPAQARTMETVLKQVRSAATVNPFALPRDVVGLGRWLHPRLVEAYEKGDKTHQDNAVMVAHFLAANGDHNDEAMALFRAALKHYEVDDMMGGE